MKSFHILYHFDDLMMRGKQSCVKLDTEASHRPLKEAADKEHVSHAVPEQWSEDGPDQ